MQFLRRLAGLSRGERRLLVRATILTALVQLALGRVPFSTLRRLVTRGRHHDNGSREDDRGLADQVVWAVTAASRRVPGQATCLSRALTVHALLHRRGCPSRLHIGVVRGNQGALAAHAWVESGGRILIGGTESEIGRFTPLAAFDAERACAPRSGSPVRASR